MPYGYAKLFLNWKEHMSKIECDLVDYYYRTYFGLQYFVLFLFPSNNCLIIYIPLKKKS